MAIENRIKMKDIEEINVNREERMRTSLDMSFVSNLAKQIKDHALINPITIDENDDLIAGENRLAAFTMMKDLGIPCPYPEYKNWTVIPTRVVKKVSSIERGIMELAENLGRNDMTWQDKARGLLKIYLLFKEEEEEASKRKLAEALNLTYKTVIIFLGLAENLDDPQIANAETYSTASNILQRKRERAISSIMDDVQMLAPAPAVPENVMEGDAKDSTPEQVEEFKEARDKQGAYKILGGSSNLPTFITEPQLPFRGIAEDFFEFAKSYSGNRFNLIHLDPPYGINLHKSNTMQKSGRGQYEDSPELFDQILQCFFDNQDRLCSSSAHMLFWHSAPDREKVVKLLTDNGWRVWKYPIIWHKSDNTGLFPDPARGPRHTYEMATMASRGDRKIVKLVSDSYSSPAIKSSGHESEKPVEMLEHFFTMLVDQSTNIFDPTGGSGNAILAAQNKGANSGLFLELEEYYPNQFNKKQREKEKALED